MSCQRRRRRRRRFGPEDETSHHRSHCRRCCNKPDATPRRRRGRRNRSSSGRRKSSSCGWRHRNRHRRLGRRMRWRRCGRRSRSVRPSSRSRHCCRWLRRHGRHAGGGRCHHRRVICPRRRGAWHDQGRVIAPRQTMRQHLRLVPGVTRGLDQVRRRNLARTQQHLAQLSHVLRPVVGSRRQHPVDQLQERDAVARQALAGQGR